MRMKVLLIPQNRSILMWYVTSDDDGNLEVSSYLFADKNNPESKGEGVFTNDYSSQHNTLKDLTVKKEGYR